MLARVQNWETRSFHDFLVARESEPFAWGVNDCCLFPADGILAMTGVDPAVEFRGKYTDEAGAFALIKSVTGGETVGDAAAYCAAKVGMVERQHALMAQRGDLVVVENARRLIAGLVHLSGRHVVSVAETGAVRLPISAVKRAWGYE